MPSTKQSITHVQSGGFNQENYSHASDQNAYWDLLNLRPDNGAIVQTPLLIAKQALTNLTGDTNSPVRFITLASNQNNLLRYFVLTEANGRYIDPTALSTQTLVPFVVQTAVPNNTTVNGQALLYSLNNTDFAAATDTIDVEIVTATTARWRRNGGSWTTFTIALENTIGSNGLKVGFTTITGFTAADKWTWTRSAAVYVGTYPTYGVQAAIYRKDIYLAGYDRQVLRVRDGFVSGVGYKRVYGKYVAVFYNHLVVAQFAQAQYDAVLGQTDSYDASTTPWLVAWSDLNNPDNFFSTLNNEADSYIVPANAAFDNTQPGITGMATYYNQLYLFASDEMFVMNYVGLPNVMQVECMGTGVGSYYQNGVVSTNKGIFFISRDNVCRFDGARVNKIGYPVAAKFFAEVCPASDPRAQKLFGMYDADKAEVVWTYFILQNTGVYQERQLCYQIDFNRFYFRNLPSASTGVADVRAIGKYYQAFQRLVYGGNQQLYVDYKTGLETLANSAPDAVDAAAAITYTQPYAETMDSFHNDLFHVKEVDTLFLDATYESADGVQVSYTARLFSALARTFTALSTVWTTSTINGILSLPRVSGRVFAFRFKFTGTKPVGGRVNAWQEFVYGQGKDVEK